MGKLRTRSARHQGRPVQRGAWLLGRFGSKHLRFRLEPHGPGHKTRQAQNLKVGTSTDSTENSGYRSEKPLPHEGVGRTDNTPDVRLEVTDSFLLLLERAYKSSPGKTHFSRPGAT